MEVKFNWRYVLAGLLVVVLLLGSAAVAGYFYLKHDHAVVLQQEQLKQADTLAKALNISQAEAKDLQKKLAEAKQPVVNYTIAAPTVQAAAEQVKKDIDAGKSPANNVPADKTVVTPNTQDQKVDVYRITLDKPRGIGAYVSTESAGAMVQYKNAVLFGGPRFHGGYEIGAGYMIRF
jgi:Tfp pilus assembly protein PilV